MNTTPQHQLSSNQPLSQSSPLAELDPEAVKDLIIISKALIIEGNNTPEKLTAALVKEFGDDAKPYAKALFNKASKKLVKATRTPTEIRDGINPEKPLSGKTISNMVRGHLTLGTPEDQILERIHEELQQVWPMLSLDEVREAYVSYGRVKFPELKDIAKSTLPAVVPAQVEPPPEADVQDNKGPAKSTVPDAEQPPTSEAVFDMLMKLCGFKPVKTEDSSGGEEVVPRKD